MLLASCSSGAVQPTGTVETTLPPNRIEIQDGGSVTVGVPYLPSNFNPSTPAGANPVTQMVMQQVLPQAFVIDPTFVADTTGFIDSAELISVSPETIAYTIDAKATWSDGVPITVQDFIYNWHEQLLNAGSLPFSGVLAGYEDISSITGSPDGKTVTVTFSTPYADWESLFADLVPAHIGQEYGWAAAFEGFDPARVISGGPFEVTSFVPGVQLTLARNPKWWGTPAHLSDIVFKVVPPGANEWSLLESGTLDVGEMVPNTVADVVAELRGLSTATTLSAQFWQLVFNANDPVVSSVYVRQAVAEGLDRTQLVEDTIGLLDPGAPVMQNRLFLSDAPGLIDNSGSYRAPDPIKAGALLFKAGYRLLPSGYYGLIGPGGPRDSTPLTLTITGPSGDSLASAVEEVFQAEMKSCGILVRINNVPNGALLGSVLPLGDYQVALAPFVDSPYQSFDAPVYTQLPVSSPGGTSHTLRPGSSVAAAGGGTIGAGSKVGSRNVSASGPRPSAISASGATARATSSTAATAALSTGVWQPTFVNDDVMGLQDQAITTLFTQATSQLNEITGRGLYNEIDTLLWQDLPTIPLFDMPVTLVTEPGLLNVQESPTWAGPMWDAQDWGLAENLPGVTTTTAGAVTTTAAAGSPGTSAGRE